MSAISKIGCLAFFALLVGLSGCGGGNEQNPAVQLQDAELKEVYEIYQHHIKREQKPPGKLADLAKKQYEGIYPATVEGLKKGKYIVVWGINDTGANTVLAYEKDAPTQGGRVLMADGTIKILSADEFKAVQPAAK